MKKVLPVLFIIVGLVLLFTPFLSELIIKFQSNRMATDQISNEEMVANNNKELEASYDFSAIEDVDIMAVLRGSMNFNREYTIGTLLIPDLDMDLPIMKGVNDANLMVGAGTMKADQSFGEGNFTLAGHYTKNKDLLFGGLMDITIGSAVYISNGENIYEYQIYDTIVVPDTAIEMLSDEKSQEVGKPIVSLMTCYFSSDTGKRFFALGKLVDEQPIE